MRRSAAVASAAALLLALMLAGTPPATAQLSQPEGPWAVGVRNDAEAELFGQLIAAVSYVAKSELTGEPLPDLVLASAAPKNISAETVVQMLGQVFAAASLDTDVARTLGAPQRMR